MSESSQMLAVKTSELETALSEVQEELARADATRRTQAHHRLAEVTREAREWLEARPARGTDAGGETAAADTLKAEEFLHEIRMHRADI